MIIALAAVYLSEPDDKMKNSPHPPKIHVQKNVIVVDCWFTGDKTAIHFVQQVEAEARRIDGKRFADYAAMEREFGIF